MPNRVRPASAVRRTVVGWLWFGNGGSDDLLRAGLVSRCCPQSAMRAERRSVRSNWQPKLQPDSRAGALPCPPQIGSHLAGLVELRGEAGDAAQGAADGVLGQEPGRKRFG
jgi:hypothetical protein